MQNDDTPRADEREDDTRAAVNAADDTGMVRQQEFIVQAELGDRDGGGLDSSAP